MAVKTDIQSFDDILKEIGNPGKFRMLLFFLLIGNMFPVGLNSMFIIFTAFVPKHRCKLPDYNSALSSSETLTNFTHIGSCHMKNETDNSTVQSLGCIYGMEYDSRENEWFVSTEFNLVCDRKFIRTIGLTCQYCGVMLGGLLFGFISDRYGRKQSMTISMILQTIFSVALAFMTNASAYFACGFLIGISMQGLHSTSYTASAELFHPTQRTYQGVFISIPWSFSLMFIALLFLYLQRWNHVQMVIAFSSFISLIYVWFMPESLRWLMSRGKVEEAYKVYVQFCRFNNTKLRKTAKEDLLRISMKMTENQMKSENGSYKQLLRSKKLRKFSFILGFLYFISAILYLGINFVIPKLGGNMYICYIVSGSLEVTARTISCVVFQRFGRRLPLALIIIACSGCCLISTLVRFYSIGGDAISEYISIIFALVGMFLLTAGFSGLGLFLTEIYPTPLRAVGLGFCVTCGRIGGVIVPAVMLLESVWEPLPIVLGSFFSTLSGISVLFLPETNKKPLLDSVNELKN